MATVIHSVISWEIGQASIKFGSFVVPCLGVYVTCNNNTWNPSDNGILRITKAQAEAIAAAFRASNIVSACGISCTPRALWGGTFTTETITGDNNLSVVFSSYHYGSSTDVIEYSIKQGGLIIVKQDPYATIETNGKLGYAADPIFIDKATNRVIAGTAKEDVDIYTYPVNVPEHTTVCDNKIPCIVGGTLSVGTSSGVYLESTDTITGGKLLGEEIDPTPEPPDTDPYGPGGNTEPGGGDGDFDDNTEPIEFSEDPTLSAVDTGFITLFNPSVAQLNDLANFMWGSLFDLENWKKLFADPMDAILGLSIVPVSVPNGGESNVKVGNIDTGVAMTKAAKQYVNVDCGTLNVKEYWGAYLDYSPYTKAEIFLPFIGTHPLDIDDVMKKSVHVKYKVDILSGACIAQIKCGDAVLYSFAGQCAATIPVTGRDWTNVVGSALSIVGNVAGAALTGGMTAPSAAVNVAQAVTNVIKPNIQKSGNVAGMAGIMGIQKPYLILTRPRQAVPKYQNHYTGYPSFMTTKLSKCNGYTEVEAIHLEGVPGTSEELNEIERLLRNGVIF